MKDFLIVLLLLISSNMFSQEKTKEVTFLNETFGYIEKCNVLKKDKSILHGPYTRIVQNKVAVTGQYDHNNKIGEWKFNDYNGTENYTYDYTKNEITSIKASCENQIVILGNDTLKCKVDRPALFEGSNIEILNYLKRNLRYPDRAAENGIKERVIVGLVISEAGVFEYVYIIRGVEESLNLEALRVFSEFKGNWFPAIYNGQKVKSVLAYPVTFNSINSL